MTLRIVVAGVAGRMGREVVAAAAADPSVAVVGGTARPESIGRGTSWEHLFGPVAPGARLYADPRAAAGAAGAAGAMIDFTGPEGAVAVVRACAEAGVPVVSGTTGLTDDQMAALEEAAAVIPVFYARNMSAGVGVLVAAVSVLAQALEGYDAEIVEVHHRGKADAPSGTALALAEAVAAARGGELDGAAMFGRWGIARRRDGEIGIHAVRAGGNAGEHVVVFADEGEEIRLVHRAYGRAAFARGALRAARFVAAGERRPGFYGPADLAGEVVP